MSGELTVHGTFPEYVIESVGCDRYGITTIVIKKEIDSDQDEFPWSLMVPSACPNIGVSVPCTGVTFESEPGKYIFKYRLEGVNGDVAFGDSDRTTVYELDVSMRQEDIRTHPDFLTLEKIYGSYDEDNGGFRKLAPAGEADSVQSGTFTDTENSGKKKNPLYGVNSYLEPQMIWRRTYLDRSVDNDVYKALGTIDTPKRGNGANVPQLPGNATWLKTDVRASWRGNIWQITEEWTASGRYGWNRHIYRRRG